MNQCAMNSSCVSKVVSFVTVMCLKKNSIKNSTEIEPLEVTESIIVGVDKEKDDSMEAAQQSTKSTFTIIYDMFSHVMMLSYSSGKHTVGKKSLAAAATCIPQKEFVYTSYKLPSYYGQNLDIKMKNGVPFNFLIIVLLPESWANLYNNILLQAILKSFVLLFANLYQNTLTCSGERRKTKLISR
jgi:hypothetical protein